MRIEAYNQISQIYNVEKTKNVNQKLKESKNDKLEISQQGIDFQVAKKAVADTADVREDLVAKYKSEMQSGQYEVSTSDFANKVIESYNKFMY